MPATRQPCMRAICTAICPTPPAAASPPPGYATSCARDVPWGRTVAAPFVALAMETPDAVTVLPVPAFRLS